MDKIRQPAVAGMFYPADPIELKTMIQQMLSQAESKSPTPKAVIVPHAGYIYSGPIAANAYHLIAPLRQTIKRVVLLGPSHRVPLLGLAAVSATQFATPLGNISVDQNAIAELVNVGFVTVMDEAHMLEHSLEVQLPFLQTVLSEFTLVPLVVGDAGPQQVAQVLNRLWGGAETLIVISSDLSHYHDYQTAQTMDKHTSAAIEHFDPSGIAYENACGRNPINGLLTVAREKGLQVTTLDLRNSGDTAGPRDQVVGYGAYVFH